MTPILMKTAAAIAAVAGLALAPTDGAQRAAYDRDALTSLTSADVAQDAKIRFERADRNGDGVIDADEYTALRIVTAELAQLNGFITIEQGDDFALVHLPGATPSALPRGAHDRIAAVARAAFYHFAGEDGRLQADEFTQAHMADFNAADRNRNQRLARRELNVYAQRQAAVSAGS